MGEAPYQVIVRMFAVADDYWPTITARYYQIDLLEVPLIKFLDLIFGWCREVITDPNEWEKFLFELEEPIPGFTTNSEAAAEAEGEAFMAAMGTLTGDTHG